ncbi:MAG TPA: alpha/beta hydrolase [Chloroflexi bacterium]|nr:alpha/beta hydrolase [Chloroflexota bacterium]
MLLEKILSSFIYYPLPWHQGKPEQRGLEYKSVWLKAEDGVPLHGWYFPHKKALASLLFCHGNAGNISHRLQNIAGLVAAGFNVFIFDYRGYGHSKGFPSEQGLYRDAQAAWQYLLATTASLNAPRLIFGRSLGGAVAIELALHAQGEGLDGLIIESSFTSLGDMAQKTLPLPGFGKVFKSYASVGKLPHIHVPLLLIHGEEDNLIPFAHSRQLFEAANSPRFFYPIPDAGHNDTYVVGGQAYFERLAAFARDSVGE